MVFTALQRGAFAALLSAFAWLPQAAPASAQGVDCLEQSRSCREACERSCGIGDRSCVRDCRRGACLQQLNACRADDRAPTAAPIPSLSPERRSVRPAPHAMEAPAPAASAAPTIAEAEATRQDLNGRVLFLSSNLSEPSAEYYGYLLIGKNVSDSRKRAVAEAIACRLEALPNAEAAAAVQRLGLMSLPSLRDAGASRVTADEVLAAYDFTRAARWLRAAGYATGQEFHPNSAIVFIGSRIQRARQMDGVALPGSRDRTDPVVADASGLSANFAAAWVGQIIDGLRAGNVRSRQELQVLMEASSWIDWASQPLRSLVSVAQASDAEAPEACPR